ncbi:S9 family peptidase [Sphingomonas sp. AOB5]|uniref:S9 family peptidase n=1 Tax=Sphingomonas sp. AOB5 TaxID=3034017 RepID=UPI0023F6434E|nr:S9 family peptidase [Sphingomonas sp. AOB5]MDF7777605.1 S9 family peptidase [Sphingomonas sp. AOB5]
MILKQLGAWLAALLLASGTPALAQSAPAAQGAVPSAADFAAPSAFHGPSLSPDGKHIVGHRAVRGKQAVVMINLDAPGRPVGQIPVPDGNRLAWVRWAGNTRLLLSLSRVDRMDGEEVRIRRLIMIDLATGQNRVLGPSTQGFIGDDLLHIDRDGKFVLLNTQANIFSYPSVYRVDLATGGLKIVVPAQDGVWDWYSDSSGVVRVGTGGDPDAWWMLYRPDATSPFKRVLRRKHNDADDGAQQFMTVAGSDLGYAVANGANGRLALYRYDFKAATLGELVYEHPRVDMDNAITGANDALLGVSFTDDRDGTMWLDPELKAVQVRLDRTLPGATNWIASVSADKTRMLILSRSGNAPGFYYFYDRTLNQLQPIATTHPALEGKQLSPVRPVQYAARDGLEIRGYLTLPAGRDPKGLPLVVMPHGGPFVRDTGDFDSWAQFLASRGYVVLQPNFRGSTGFGRAFVERGSGQWGRGMQDDIDDGVKWLAGEGTIDPKRVCIMGASYGGYAAMWAAARNPELYRCAISFAGISDVGSMLRYDRSAFVARRYFRNWREKVQGEKDFDLGLISPLNAAARMTVPILIGHGTEDDNVPVYQSRRLRDALVKAGRKPDYVEYKGEGHDLEDIANATDFLNRVAAFLDRHNPAQ